MKNLIADVSVIGFFGGIFALFISILRLVKNIVDGLRVTVRDIIYTILDGIWGVVFCVATYLAIQYLEPVDDPTKMKIIELLCCGFFAGANGSLRQLIYKLWIHLITSPKKFISDCKEVIRK